MIRTHYTPATSSYGAHMGTCYHHPATAAAWFDGGAKVELSAVNHLDLAPAELVEKAIAILRRQTRCGRS